MLRQAYARTDYPYLPDVAVSDTDRDARVYEYSAAHGNAATHCDPKAYKDRDSYRNAVPDQHSDRYDPWGASDPSGASSD